MDKVDDIRPAIYKAMWPNQPVDVCEEHAQAITNIGAAIVKRGRICNDGKQYCYLTSFNDLVIVSDLNKRSDRFVAYNQNLKEEKADGNKN